MRFASSTVGIRRHWKSVLRIFIIQLAIELQINVSSYLYTAMKIPFKQLPTPKILLLHDFWLFIVILKGHQNAAKQNICALQHF